MRTTFVACAVALSGFLPIHETNLGSKSAYAQSDLPVASLYDLRMIRTGNVDQRAEAAQALGKYLEINPKCGRSIRALIRALDDKSVLVQGMAERALGWKDGNPIVIDALGRSKDLRVLGVLSENLYGGKDTRSHAADALGEIFLANPEIDRVIYQRRVYPAISALIDVLQHEKNATVRAKVAAALGKAKVPRAIPVLTDAKYDDDAGVRSNARRALREIGHAHAKKE